MRSGWFARIACGWLLLSVFAALSGCAAVREEPEQLKAEVREVLDGDTIQVEAGGHTETVRFLFVDTPETNHPEKGEQPFGREAKRFVRDLLPPGTEVTLILGTEKRDKYGRLLAHVRVKGRSVQQLLLERGLARVAYVFQADAGWENAYRETEERGKEKRLRIWSVDGYVREDGFHPEAVRQVARFVASKHSEVYHPVQCEDARNIKESNRVWFRTEEEAKASGRHRSRSPCWGKLAEM